jgi:hypothetical protein
LISTMTGAGPAYADSWTAPQADIVCNLAPTQRRRDADREIDAESLSAVPSGVVTIRRRIIIRIPMVEQLVPLPRDPGGPVAQAASPNRSESGPMCLAQRLIRGAAISEGAGVVFVMTTNNRYRAGLERGCQPADFQSGFYINPTADGVVCAGRDLLHARSGANCMITRFSAIQGGMWRRRRP